MRTRANASDLLAVKYRGFLGFIQTPCEHRWTGKWSGEGNRTLVVSLGSFCPNAKLVTYFSIIGSVTPWFLQRFLQFVSEADRHSQATSPSVEVSLAPRCHQRGGQKFRPPSPSLANGVGRPWPQVPLLKPLRQSAVLATPLHAPAWIELLRNARRVTRQAAYGGASPSSPRLQAHKVLTTNIGWWKGRRHSDCASGMRV